MSQAAAEVNFCSKCHLPFIPFTGPTRICPTCLEIQNQAQEIEDLKSKGKDATGMYTETPAVPDNCQQSETTPGVKQFATGAVRSSDREGQRYDLISPIGLRRLAETCDEGAQKYGDYNWERGMPIGEMLNHAVAHIYNYLAGDRTEDHLAHAAWNLFGAMHSEEKWPELNKLLRVTGCEPPKEAFDNGDK